MILIAARHAHHETSKHDSPSETKVKEKQNYHGFEFKSHQVNDSSQSNQGTDHLVSQSKWFLNLPLDESIDNKSTKFEVRIQDPMKHS
jgi:hypothetical protein